jgi:hypothetical protein
MSTENTRNTRDGIFNREVIPVIRIARAVSDLDLLAKMYVDGLNFHVIGQFENHNGFDGVILGHPDWPYHLEFTYHINNDSLEQNKSVNESANELVNEFAPHPDDALVFYSKNETIWLEQCKNMEKAGFSLVIAFNPYWNIYGQAFRDYDGH